MRSAELRQNWSNAAPLQTDLLRVSSEHKSKSFVCPKASIVPVAVKQIDRQKPYTLLARLYLVERFCMRNSSRQSRATYWPDRLVRQSIGSVGHSSLERMLR